MLFERIWHVILFLCRKHSFAEYHYSDIIKKPIIITPQYITLKESVRVYHNARIEGVSLYKGVSYSPKIVFNKGVSIQQNLHLTCAESIIIGENTAIAANVTITDIHHPYNDVFMPIEQQPIEVRPVIIGPDSKIYNNVVVLPGTIIGKHVTVGANSVVCGTFPDYCVIVGAPAVIVKKYDPNLKLWRKTDKKGHFIETT